MPLKLLLILLLIWNIVFGISSLEYRPEMIFDLRLDVNNARDRLS